MKWYLYHRGIEGELGGLGDVRLRMFANGSILRGLPILDKVDTYLKYVASVRSICI